MNESSPPSPNEHRRLRILFTEGSSISARQALYDLGSRHEIDVLDPSPLCQCRFSRLTRRWHRCPSYTTDPCQYLTFLAARLAAERYDVLLPLHDEVYLLSRVRDELAKRTAIAIAEFSNVALLQSKLQFLTLVRDLGLQCPQTEVFAQSSELGNWSNYPVYLKLDFGTAGQTVRFVQNRAALDAALADFAESGWWSKGEPFLLQQPARGDQCVVRAIFQHGRLAAIHSSKLLVRGVGGAATVRQGVHHGVVVDHVRRLGEHLKFHGALFGDYFYDETTQTPEYIEFNPRIGDSANASYSGVNMPQHWVDVSLGRETGAPAVPRAGVSTHANMLILMSRALEGGSRGDIWREMRRQFRSQGLYQTSHEELTRPKVDWLSALPYVWVAGRLLARPASAQKMVHRTVKNYALSADAARLIRDLPQEQLVACFR
jgi:predicted ATP-grasp superfamily ATP-dependent carboligase